MFVLWKSSEEVGGFVDDKKLFLPQRFQLLLKIRKIKLFILIYDNYC